MGSFSFIEFSTTSSVNVRGLFQESASLKGLALALLFRAHSLLKSSFTYLLHVIKPFCGCKKPVCKDLKKSHFTKKEISSDLDLLKVCDFL